MMNTFNQPNFMGTNTQRNPYFPNSAYNTGASTNNIIWVQGIEGAKAWQLNPNSMMILLDSEEEGKMYIKVSDNIGMCSLRVFNYKETDVDRNSNNSNTTEAINKDLDLSQFVRKDELSSLIKEILDEQSISTVAAVPANESSDGNPAKSKVITVLKKQS